MLFFLFRKSYIFWLFLFSKKFIISHEKIKKTNNLNSKTKLFSVKSKKNRHYLSLQCEHRLSLKDTTCRCLWNENENENDNENLSLQFEPRLSLSDMISIFG